MAWLSGQRFGFHCESLVRPGGPPSVGAPRIPGCAQAGPHGRWASGSAFIASRWCGRVGLPSVGAPRIPGCTQPGPQGSLGHMGSRSQSSASSVRSSRWWWPASPPPLLPRGVVREPPLLLIQGCQVAVSYIGMFFTKPITWPSGSAKIPMTTSSITSISGMITLPPMLAALSRYSVTSSTPT